MLNYVSNSHKLVTWWRDEMSIKILKEMFIWITFVFTNEITNGFNENIFKRYMTEKIHLSKITFIEKIKIYYIKTIIIRSTLLW